jgi:methylmalonyl-CoA mutase C-terminal domain/subunit
LLVDRYDGLIKIAQACASEVLMEGKIRVVVAKPGLDGHDRGAKVVARALRDAGMEVIYTGLRQTPEQIVNTALQEDADVIAISILSGAHMALIPRIIDLLKANNSEDIIVMAGGIIPEEDRAKLLEKGVYAIMGPGTDTRGIAETIKKAVEEKNQKVTT